jgi:hypothetical protein
MTSIEDATESIYAALQASVGDDALEARGIKVFPYSFDRLLTHIRVTVNGTLFLLQVQTDSAPD